MSQFSETTIMVQGSMQSVIEVYSDESREQTLGFVFDETTANRLVASHEVLEALQLMLDRFDFGEHLPDDHPISIARIAEAKATEA